MNQGSIWRKWDFHVHTKWTNKNDQFTSSNMDDFFYTFFRKAYENQIEAIGVTDYFSVDRYLDAVNYQKEIEDKQNDNGEPLFSPNEIEFVKNIFLFPNVELRIIPATKKGKFINLHFIFNPNYVSSLSNNFFNKIQNIEGYLMNEQGFKDYAKHLDPDILEENQYKFGVDSYGIEVGKIKELLESNKDLRENSIVAVSSKTNDGVSGLKDYYEEFEQEGGSLIGTIKSIYKLSHIIFSAAPSDKEYFIGKKTNVEEVISHAGSLKPCIIGCDAHTESDLFKRFTWIKADLTFEGLRQICFEPEQRVRIQYDMPDFKEDKLVIEKVQFISPNNVFSTNPIYLNPNLNVIIGGKSSGKSILLYSIGKTLLADHRNLMKDEGKDYKYKLDRDEKEFDFEITTKGGFLQRLIRSSDENSILPEIKYIPQNHLVKLAETEINKTGASLNKLVRDLITEDYDSKELYQGFLDTVKANDKQRNNLIDSFLELQSDINALEVELKNKSNKEVLIKNIANNEAKIDELNKSTGLTEEEIARYKELQLKLEENSAERQQLNDDFNSIRSFNSDLLLQLKALKLRKESIIGSIKTQEIRDFYSIEYLGVDTLFDEFTRIGNSIELETKDGISFFKSECTFSKLFEANSSTKKELALQIEPFLKTEAIKKSVEELRKSIENDKKALSEIDTLSLKIQGKKKTLDDTKNEIFELYKTNHQEYINIITALKERTTELEKDGLGIEGKAKCNFSKLWKKVYEISDGRTASYNQYPQLLSNKKIVDEIDFEAIFSEIKVLFEDIISNKYALTSRTTMMNALKIIMDDYFFDYWEITYKNDRLGEMSTGKASFVILMLIIGLSKSKAPILIDQPEDNLDNRSITSDLVSYLRNKKLERQVIIVTHNANIVVNADAENVIVANQKGQNDDHSTSQFTFDYINGSIENSFDKLASESDILKSMGIRQHIADIVEGGKEAFIKREKKYRFN